MTPGGEIIVTLGGDIRVTQESDTRVISDSRQWHQREHLKEHNIYRSAPTSLGRGDLICVFAFSDYKKPVDCMMVEKFPFFHLLKHLNPRLAIRPLTGDGGDISPVEKVDDIHQSQRLERSNKRWQMGKNVKYHLFKKKKFVKIWKMIFIIINIWNIRSTNFETYIDISSCLFLMFKL